MTDLPAGLLLVNKPLNVTSFDCVHLVKRRLQAHRVGHCGTLDPAASGLLLVLVGAATRQQDSFLGLEKEYVFKAQLGVKTSTGDREGSVIEEKAAGHVTEDTLIDVLKTFEGTSQQLPPAYAALKYKGKPYYHYARKGQEIPRVSRSITVSFLSLLSFSPPYWEGRLVCSRGTYVRTLVEDVAERIGTCGTLLALERTRIGPYPVHEALSWDALKTMDASDLSRTLRPAVPLAVHA